MLPHYEQNTMKKFLNVRNLRAIEEKAFCLKLYQKVSFHFQFQFNDKIKSNF